MKGCSIPPVFHSFFRYFPDNGIFHQFGLPPGVSMVCDFFYTSFARAGYADDGHTYITGDVACNWMNA